MEKRVLEAIADHFGADPSQLTRETDFRKDFVADDLDMIEVVMALEEEFEIDIPDDHGEGITNVGAAIDYIDKRMRDTGWQRNGR
jgi:acyl carrier protein